MIEVIYKEEKQESQGDADFVYIPRNIRQIGQVREDYKIYIEDYVYTFLVRLSRAEEGKEKQKAGVAVLTGEVKWQSGVSYLFIKGALMIDDMEAASDHIDFTEEIWGKIHAEQEKYFSEQEIVGWFFSQPQISMEMTELFARVHLKHFGGEKVLMLMEPLEREDAFFRYENNFCSRQSGYYIYYEKNPQMQAYMIEKNGELQPESMEKYEDKAVKNFRKIITGKKKEAEEQPSVFSYAATACLAIAVLAVGVNFYRNYQGVQKADEEVRQTSALIVEEVTPVPTEKAAEKSVSRDKNDSNREKEKAERASERNGVSDKRYAQGKTAGEAKAERKAKTAAEETGEKTLEKTSGSTADSEETGSSSVYREEADVRKAKRREELAVKEQENLTVASDKVRETYVIKPGDTLFQISMARYGNMEAMEEICRLNNLKLEEIIYPGQVIVLP